MKMTNLARVLLLTAAAAVLASKANLRVVTTIAAPSSRVAHRWGDLHLAEGLAAGLRRLGHVVQVRRLFEQFDVLLLPTVAAPPPAWGAEEPANLADLTALASLAGCPALSLPLPGGLGLQLVGAPGADLRLLELAQVLASVADTGE